MKKIRILIVDDVEQVRKDLRTLLSLSSNLEIAGEAGDGMEAIQETRRLQPDVVLLDLEMPILDGFTAARRIKAEQPAPRVVILSVHATPGEVERAQAAGVDGFIVKGAGYQILLNAILRRDGYPNSFNLMKGEKP